MTRARASSRPGRSEPSRPGPGFTLIEAMIALAILAGIAALVVPSAVGLRSRLTHEQAARDLALLAADARRLVGRDAAPYARTLETTPDGRRWFRVRRLEPHASDAPMNLETSLDQIAPPVGDRGGGATRTDAAAPRTAVREIAIAPSVRIEAPADDDLEGETDDERAPFDAETAPPPDALRRPPLEPQAARSIRLARWDDRGHGVLGAAPVFRSNHGEGFTLRLSPADGRPSIEWAPIPSESRDPASADAEPEFDPGEDL